MTAHPIPENHDLWWLYTDNATVLHAVPGEAATSERIREAIDWCQSVALRAECGRVLALSYPGLLSRFNAPRCQACCRASGVPQGIGTPCNEEASRRAAS